MKALNILLVEDSPLDAELIEAYLTDGGIEFSIMCVETRSEFVAALEKNCFDIILADYMLPCFNGIAALEIAREICPGVPFIFVSATLGEEVAIETLKSGATDYVLKRRLARLVPSIERAVREVRERLDRKLAEAARQESEERFRIMADTAPVMIWMSGADRLCDYFNKVWLEFTGRTLAQEMGNGWMESLHPDDLQHFLEVSNSAFEARVEYRTEYRLRRADGEYRWILGRGLPRYRCDRTFAGYIGSCIDISDRKHAEQEKAAALEREQAARVQAEETARELLKANQRITNILESITDGFVALDNQWRFTYANRNAAELFDKCQAEYLGKTMCEVMPCSPESKCYIMAHQAVAQKATLEYEEFDRALNKWFNVRLYPSESGLSAYFQDITSRKQTEAALQASEEKLRFLALSNLIGILFGDIYGGISDANDEFLRIVGYTQEQLHRGELCWIDITPPEYLPLDEIGIAEAKAKGACTPYEKEYVRSDGSRICVLVGYVLLGEKREEAVALILDISERKGLEAQLRDRAEELDRLNRVKDEFLATLSHELRTPLNAMVGWTQLLRHHKFDEQTTIRALSTLDRNTRSLATSIEDLLDLSQIITGKLSLNLRSVDAIATVEAAIDTLAPAAHAKSIEITTDFDPAVGRIYGDAGRLQQIAWNLLSNAIKFTPDGKEVKVALRKVEGAIACKLESGDNLPGAIVEIEVSDTGEGIDQEFLPRIFDRFSQADSTTTRSHNGLGLGLAIVRHLVEMHGGTVQAESAGKGQGSRFFVRLPAKHLDRECAFSIATQENFSVREKKARSPLPEFTASTNLSGLRVLLVDDDWDCLEFARTVLEDCQAEVETADSAREALEAIHRRAPDILAIELAMPVENGCSLLQQVRAIAGGEIPALALTASARVEERLRALREGFQLHLPKPIDPAELTAAVASLAARHH